MAQDSGESCIHLFFGEELLWLGLIRLPGMCGFTVQQKSRRIEQYLSGRLAGVHGYQFEARALLGCQFDIHSVNGTRWPGGPKYN